MAVIIEQDIWLVLSNLTFLFPAIYLFTAQLFVESFSYFNITLWSSVYHLCFNCEVCIIQDREVLQFMDFFSSYLCIGLIVVYFIDVNPRKYKVILQCLIAIILLFISALDYFNTITYVIVLVTFIPFGLFYSLVYFLKWLRDKGCFKRINFCNSSLIDRLFSRRTAPFHPADIVIFIIGVSLFVSSILIQTYVRNVYWITHSIWHVLAAISAILIYTVYNKKNIIVTIIKKSNCCKKKESGDTPDIITE